MQLGCALRKTCLVTCYERNGVPYWIAWDTRYLVPPELGQLSALETLVLSGKPYTTHRLTGSIPLELGQLSTLRSLDLSLNHLTGSIPPELGDLANLSWINLDANDLAGPIPPNLGNLASLWSMRLSGNELSGPIPPELARLPELRALEMDGNALTGSIPPELSGLSTLERLRLGGNNLTGPVPAELGAMAALRELGLGNNRGMAGSLPAELTALSQLEALLAGGTGLCAPSDPGFQSWLDGIRKRRVATCTEGDPPPAYLVQAVQSREFPVPLVARERALLRVFPTTARTTSEGIPAVRARFYLDGRETHVANVPAKSTAIPTRLYEGDLSKSANVEIPGSVVRPGLEVVIEVDPQDALDPGLGVTRRIPETGSMPVEVEAMPAFHLTVVPFLWSPRPDSLVLETARGMAEDPHGHHLLEMTRTLLPVEDMVVMAHEPVVTSHNSAGALLRETVAIRVLEGERGYYLGTMTGEFEGIDGLAYGTPGRVSFSKTDLNRGRRSEFVIAHELGHNMNLPHPPGCEAGYPDYSYPHENGLIGGWGYDFDAARLVPPHAGDLMSYCPYDWDEPWISAYHFTNALHYRVSDEGEADVYAAGPPQESLLLWGGVDEEGVPFLEPSFVVDAPPVLPDATGEHRLTGRNAGGDEIFSLDFALPETADGDGSSSFAFVVPVQPGWAGNLASITLSGPGGSATLDGNTDLPMTILLDPATGRVRAILRELPQADAAAALAPQAGPDSLDVLFSRGIPDAAAWGR